MESEFFESIKSRADLILNKALELGASEVEIHIVELRRIRVDAAKGKINRVTAGNRVDAGVRVVIGKKKGNAGGVISSPRDLDKILEDALKIARVSKEDPEWLGFPENLGSGGTVEVFDKKIAEVEPKDLVEITKNTIESLSEFEGVRHTESMTVSVIEKTFIANSRGGSVEGERTLLTVYTGASSGAEGSYYDYYSGRRLDVDKIIEISRTVGRRAKEAAEAKPLETGTYTLILEPKVVSGILSSVLVPAISAENVQQGRSPLKGKIGEEVLNEEVTIKDSPYMPWLSGSTAFDDEGVPTIEKDIFSKGILNTYLYDTYTAKKEGKKSTGNGFKRSPWSDPTPSPTNIVVDVKTQELDSIVSDIKRGAIVGLTIGEWLSNPVSGMINATVTFGYLIENGNISRPIKGVIVSGSLYEALGKKFGGGAGKVECFDAFCTPSLVLNDFRLAGR